MPIHQPNRPSGIAVSFWMAAALSVYALMMLITLARLLEMSGGIPVFDMMPAGYDNEYALSLLTALGSDGRNYYLWRQIPLDLIYPALEELKNYEPDQYGTASSIQADQSSSKADGATAKPNSKRVGRRKKAPVKRSKRGTGKVAD